MILSKQLVDVEILLEPIEITDPETKIRYFLGKDFKIWFYSEKNKDWYVLFINDYKVIKKIYLLFEKYMILL